MTGRPRSCARPQTKLPAGNSMLVRCMCRSGTAPNDGAKISNRPSGLSVATQCPAPAHRALRASPENARCCSELGAHTHYSCIVARNITSSPLQPVHCPDGLGVLAIGPAAYLCSVP